MAARNTTTLGLLVSTLTACGSTMPRDKAAPGRDSGGPAVEAPEGGVDSGASEDTGDPGDTGSGTTDDTGDPLGPPPEFSEPCPEGPFSGSSWDTESPRWRPAQQPVTGGHGAVYVETVVETTPDPWGNSTYGFWDGRRLVHGTDHEVHSDATGLHTLSVTPVDSAGQRGGTLLCDLVFEHREDVHVEFRTHPDFHGERELHFVNEGEQLFDRSEDISYCNGRETYERGDRERGWMSWYEWRHSGAWPMAQEEGGIDAVDPDPQRRTLYVLDYGDGTREDRGLPYESSIRIYLGPDLVFEDRARIPPGEVWTVGTVDIGAGTVEPAPPDTFAEYTGPWTCF